MFSLLHHIKCFFVGPVNASRSMSAVGECWVQWGQVQDSACLLLELVRQLPINSDFYLVGCLSIPQCFWCGSKDTPWKAFTKARAVFLRVCTVGSISVSEHFRQPVIWYQGKDDASATLHCANPCTSANEGDGLKWGVASRLHSCFGRVERPRHTAALRRRWSFLLLVPWTVLTSPLGRWCCWTKFCYCSFVSSLLALLKEFASYSIVSQTVRCHLVPYPGRKMLDW